MSHPPQGRSNRSLPLWTLLAVLWQTGSLIGMLLGLSWCQAHQDTSSENLPSVMFLGVFMAVLLCLEHRLDI